MADRRYDSAECEKAEKGVEKHLTMQKNRKILDRYREVYSVDCRTMFAVFKAPTD